MKFALAVGRRQPPLRAPGNHAPAFLQTAAKNGIPPSVIRSIFGELLEAGERAVSEVMSGLPPGFPQKLAESIAGGLRARLRLVENADMGVAE